VNVVERITDDDIRLAEHAEVIRALGKRAVHDIIEIGRRLIEAKELAGHGGWLPWLEREFGWDERTAQRFISVGVKSDKLSDLNVPVSGLYLLAAPSTPDEVIDAVAERGDGERLSLKDIKQMIADASEAEQAKAEKRIAKLVAQHDVEVAELREAAEKEPGLSSEDIEALIDKAVEPLKKKIENYKKQLRKEPVKRVPDPHGLVAMRLRMALETLVEAMTHITPRQKIESQQVTTAVTGKSLRDGLAGDIKNARLIAAWLAQFLAEVDKIR
jgi:hypothetical protein